MKIQNPYQRRVMLKFEVNCSLKFLYTVYEEHQHKETGLRD